MRRVRGILVHLRPVASSDLLTVLACSNTTPARLLRSSEKLAFVPDNLRMGDDGKLLTAGLHWVDPACGDVSALASSAAIEEVSNITIGITVGDQLWIGTFLGDRIAYRSLAEDA